MAREFKGKAGRIYLQRTDDNDAYRWEAWFEDFCIIGAGPTEIAALEDAVRHTADMQTLAKQALRELSPQRSSVEVTGYLEW